MTHVSDEQLALYVGGDLLRAEADAVEEHLRSCAECRTLIAGFQDSRAAVLSSLGEPTDEELSDLRCRVVRQLQGRRQAARNWMWVAALTAAAAIIAVLSFPWQQPRRVVHPDAVTTSYLRVPYRQVVQPSIPNLEVNVEPVRVKRHRPAPGLRTVALLAEREGPPVLKMTTSDPDVIILWQLNERTQRQ